MAGALLFWRRLSLALNSRRITRRGGQIAVSLAALLLSGPRWAEAQTTFTWTTLSGGNASGSWNTSSNWNSGAGPVASGADNTADFSTLDITANSTVTLDGNKTIGHLVFGDTNTGTPANWTIDRGTPTTSTLTLAVTSGSPTITVNSVLATFFGTRPAGSAGLTKEGTGTLYLRSGGTYTGGTTINGGVLQIGPTSGSAFGAGAITNNASLVFDSEFFQAITTTVANTISGSGALTKAGEGTTSLTASNSYSGMTTISEGALIANDGVGLPTGSFLNLNGGVLMGSGAASFTRSLGANGSGKFQWNTDGGGFAAKGGLLTVNIGGAGGELTWGTAVGSEIVGTLQFGGREADATALLVNGIDLNNTATAATRTISVSDGSGSSHVLAAEISGVIRNSNAAAGLNITGPTSSDGTIFLSAPNAYAGTTTIGASLSSTPVLRANDGVGLPSASFLSLNGGVLEGSGTTSFTRSLGTSGSGKFQWASNGGGFSAHGGQLTVNIGGAGAELVWGTSVGSQIVGPLRFGSRGSNAKTLFVHGIDLNNTGTATTQTIIVDFGIGGDAAEISGVIRNSNASAGLTIGGGGTLILSGANTYTGTTTVSSAALRAVDGVGLPTASFLSLDGGVFEGSGTTTFTRSLGTSGSGKFQLDGGVFGGGFAAHGGQLTVDIGGAGGEVVWGTAIGSEIVGVLKFGARDANAKTLFVNGIDLNNTATPATREIRIATGTGGDSTEISGVIRNSNAAGALTIGFGGTLILSGANTYSGTTVNGAQMQIGNGGTTGSLGTGPVANSGTLIFNRSDSMTVGNAISGFGGLTQAGAGTTILTGANSYGGNTTISAGALQIGNGGTTGTLGNGFFVTNNASLVFNRSDSLTVGNFISGTGSVTQSGSGTTILTGFSNSYGGGTIINSGVLQVGNGVSLNGSLGTGGVTNNASLVFNQLFSPSIGNIISGTGSVTQAGPGTITLTGANSYMGDTLVNAGTLTLSGSGSFASSPTISLATGTTLSVNGVTGGANHNGTSFALASGQTLKGTGTVSGSMVVRSGATLAPGASIGTLNTTGFGNVSINSGGTLALELDIGGVMDADLLNVVGSLNVSGATLNLTLLDVTPGLDKTFLVVNNLSGPIAGTFASITGLPVGYLATLNYAYSGTDVLGRVGTGNDLAVTIITTIPEARAWLLVGAAMALVGVAALRRQTTTSPGVQRLP